MTTRTRVIRTVQAGLLAFAASAALCTTNAPSASAAEPTTGSDAKPALQLASSPLPADRHLSSLDEAVSAGRVEAGLVTALRSGTSVRALVDFTEGGALQELSATNGRGLAADLTAMRERSDSVKAAAGRKVGTDMQVVTKYRNLSSSEVLFTSEQALLRAANSGEITAVHALHAVHVGAANADAASLNLVRQPSAASSGYRGAGTMVAVLDTGLDQTRATFGSCTAVNTPSTCRVAGNWDYADQDNTFDDSDMHGTNVAGIVANVAPGTRLLGMDVFNGKDTNAALMSKALDDVITLKGQGWPIASVNMSIYSANTFETSTCGTQPLATAFTRLRQVGVIPVTIAGNDAPLSGTFRNGVAWPGCLPDALTVGAVFDSADPLTSRWCSGTPYADRIACFSQGGPLLDVWAPGLIVDAAGIAQAGTSQAAPHLAGAIAVLRAARPTVDVPTLQNAITSSGPTISDTRSGTAYNRHRLDLVASLTTLLGTSGDTSAPTVATPGQVPALDYSIGADGTVPTTINWSATDASGIAAYEVYASTNGGAWTAVTLPSVTTQSITFSLTPGSTYTFTVRAKDGAGNWSGWKQGVTFTPANVGDADTAMTYSSGWTRYARTYATSGTTTASSTTGSTVRVVFTGRAFAWVATKHAGAGLAKLFLDGVPQDGSWDLYSSTTQPRRIVAAWSGSYGTHTVEIKVLGTTGRPSVDIDSLTVLR